MSNTQSSQDSQTAKPERNPFDLLADEPVLDVDTSALKELIARFATDYLQAWQQLAASRSPEASGHVLSDASWSALLAALNSHIAALRTKPELPPTTILQVQQLSRQLNLLRHFDLLQVSDQAISILALRFFDADDTVAPASDEALLRHRTWLNAFDADYQPQQAHKLLRLENWLLRLRRQCQGAEGALMTAEVAKKWLFSLAAEDKYQHTRLPLDLIKLAPKRMNLPAALRDAGVDLAQQRLSCSVEDAGVERCKIRYTPAQLLSIMRKAPYEQSPFFHLSDAQALAAVKQLCSNKTDELPFIEVHNDLLRLQQQLLRNAQQDGADYYARLALNPFAKGSVLEARVAAMHELLGLKAALLSDVELLKIAKTMGDSTPSEQDEPWQAAQRAAEIRIWAERTGRQGLPPVERLQAYKQTLQRLHVPLSLPTFKTRPELARSLRRQCEQALAACEQNRLLCKAPGVPQANRFGRRYCLTEAQLLNGGALGTSSLNVLYYRQYADFIDLSSQSFSMQLAEQQYALNHFSLADFQQPLKYAYELAIHAIYRVKTRHRGRTLQSNGRLNCLRDQGYEFNPIAFETITGRRGVLRHDGQIYLFDDDAPAKLEALTLDEFFLALGTPAKLTVRGRSSYTFLAWDHRIRALTEPGNLQPLVVERLHAEVIKRIDELKQAQYAETAFESFLSFTVPFWSEIAGASDPRHKPDIASIILDSLDLVLTLVSMGMPFVKALKAVALPARLMAKGGRAGHSLSRASLTALRELADFVVPVFTAAELLKGSAFALGAMSRWSVRQIIKHAPAPAKKTIDWVNLHWGTSLDGLPTEAMQTLTPRCRRGVPAVCDTGLRSHSPDLVDNLAQDANLTANDYFRNLRDATLAEKTKRLQAALTATAEEKLQLEIASMQQALVSHHAFKEEVIARECARRRQLVSLSGRERAAAEAAFQQMLKQEKIVEFIPLKIEPLPGQSKIKIEQAVTDLSGEPVPGQHISHSAAYTARGLICNVIAQKVPARWQNGRPIRNQPLPFSVISLQLRDVQVDIGFGAEVKLYQNQLEKELQYVAELKPSGQSQLNQDRALSAFKRAQFESGDQYIELVPLIYAPGTRRAETYTVLFDGLKSLANTAEKQHELAKIISYFLETATLDFSVAPDWGRSLAQAQKDTLKQTLSQLFAITQLAEETRTGGTGLIFETAMRMLAQSEHGTMQIASKSWSLFDILHKDTLTFFGARGSQLAATASVPKGVDASVKQAADALIAELQQRVKRQRTGFWGARRWKFDLGISPSLHSPNTRVQSADFSGRQPTPERSAEPSAKQPRLQ